MECSICHHQNHHLAVVCASCGGYLRNKVDNIDLFSTMGNLLISPKKTLERIAIAIHKNYVLLMSAIGGISLSFFLLTVTSAGEFIRSLSTLFFIGILAGIALGIATVLFTAACIRAGGKITGTPVKFRTAFATTGYAFVPMIIGVIFLLPIKIMTFGRFLFTAEPSAYSLNTTSFILFAILDLILVMWSIWIYFTGVRVVCNSSRGATALIGSVPLLLVSALFTVAAIFLRSMIGQGLS